MLASLVAALIVSSLAIYFFADQVNRGDEGGQGFNLVKPVFAEEVNATFLKDEAGISMYLKSTHPINLNDAKTQINAIEKETSDFIIGSMRLPGLSEDEDPHCFVHKDGHIVIYYFEIEPISKIIDWQHWSKTEKNLTTNKLRVALLNMAGAVAADVSGAKYYHFQYPDATKFMIIIETQKSSAGDSFNLKIPYDLTVYERSYSHYLGYAYYASDTSYVKIDGTTISTLTRLVSEKPRTDVGHLLPSQLSQGLPHNISISGYWRSDHLYGVGIALAYKEL